MTSCIQCNVYVLVSLITLVADFGRTYVLFPIDKKCRKMGLSNVFELGQVEVYSTKSVRFSN